MSWNEGTANTWEPEGLANDGPDPSHRDQNYEPHEGGCRICHDDSHFARDCPQKADAPGPGACFNCNEIGHNKVDCPHPPVERPFDGTCRICSESGHRARECPQAPAQVCKHCKQEGHAASECSAHRMHTYFQTLNIADLDGKDAYEALLKVGTEDDFDLDDAKQAIFAYAKAVPGATWAEIEECCRENRLKIHLIAKTQDIADTHTIVDLQGATDREFVVTFQTSNKPRRAKFAEGWPSSPDENITRLGSAGLPMDRMVPKCGNCGELGHTSRACPQEKVEREAIVVKCANCDMDGHRARDCKEPRKIHSRACKNCGQDGHISKDCPEPPNLDNVECKNCSQNCPNREAETCRNCHEEGHRAKDCPNERVMKCRNCDEVGHAARDCPKPRDMGRVQCRNCDEMGHTGRECPKPTDWSRVECTNCHEKGHTYKRCTKPADEGDAEEGGGGNIGGGWDTQPAVSGGGEPGWASASSAAVAQTAGAW